jgi:hypothetical protein
VLPSPAEGEAWRFAIGSLAPSFRKEFVPHDTADGTPTPNRVVEVEPADLPGVTPMPAAKKITGATVTLEYAVFTAEDGEKSLKFRFHGTIERPEDPVFLHARIEAEKDGGGVLALGAGRDTYISPWLNIEPGLYTLRFFSVNKENAENPDFYEHAEAQDVSTMPDSPPITAPVFHYQQQVTEDDEGALKHMWRLVGSWSQEESQYHWYTRVQLRPLSGADTRPLVPLLERGGSDRDFITDWFDMGAETTYQLEYVPVNRLEVPGDAVVVGSFTTSPMGAVEDVLAFQAGTFNEATQQWSPAMSWDPLKRFMLIDWGCMLPQDTKNWSAVAIFIRIPKQGGGFHHVQATGRIGRDAFTASDAGPLAYYDRIAVELKDVPETPEEWTFITCSYNRAGNPKHDANGVPLGPAISLNTLELEDQPDFNRPPDVTGLDFTTEVVAPGELDVVVTFTPGAAPASGAQIYVERPTGTEPRERGSFDYIGPGQQTIKIRESAPGADENWRVRVVSYSLNHAGRLRADSPSVTKLVPSYPYAPKVTTATGEVVVKDTETQVKGRFGFKGTYAIPDSPYFEAVEAVVVYAGDDYEHVLGRTWDGTYESDLWPMPPDPIGVEIRLYSINQEGVRNPDYYAIAGLVVSPDGNLKFDKLPIPDGGIKSGHIENLTVGKLIGLVQANQIDTINAEQIAGKIQADQINTINATQIAGKVQASQIDTVNADQIIGQLSAGQIETVNATSIQGSITANQIGAVNATTIEGVIITQQLADGILDDLNKFAQDLRPITRVTSLPTLPHAAYPNGTVVLLTSDSKLYKNNSGVWGVVLPSDTITGKIATDDIITLNANKLTGQVNAGVITHVQVSQFAGTLSAAQAGSIAISSFQGNLDVSRVSNILLLSIANFQGNLDVSRVANIGTLQISSFQGNLDVSRVANIGTINIDTFSGTLSAGKITTLNAVNVTVTGGWTDGQIANVNFSKLVVGTLTVATGALIIQSTGYALQVTQGGGIIVGFSITGGLALWGNMTDTQGGVLIEGSHLSRKANFNELTISTKLNLPTQSESYLEWTPVAKIPCHSSAGAWIGWIPVVQ